MTPKEAVQIWYDKFGSEAIPIRAACEGIDNEVVFTAAWSLTAATNRLLERGYNATSLTLQLTHEALKLINKP